MAKKKNKNNSPKTESAFVWVDQLRKGELDEKSRAKMAHYLFNESYTRAKKDSDFFGKLFPFLDLDPIRRRRREEATLALYPAARSRIFPLCPDIPDVSYFEHDWFWMACNHTPSYDTLESAFHLSVAAAIWMLDKLREADFSSVDICEHLTKDLDILDKLPVPTFFDPCHDEYIIRAMTHLIWQRNFDCKSKKGFENENSGSMYRVFMDLHTAENKQHQQVPSRMNFDTIMSMILEEEKIRAADAFTEKAWQWMERYFRSYKVLYERIDKVQNKVRNIKRTTLGSLQQFPTVHSALQGVPKPACVLTNDPLKQLEASPLSCLPPPVMSGLDPSVKPLLHSLHNMNSDEFDRIEKDVFSHMAEFHSSFDVIHETDLLISSLTDDLTHYSFSHLARFEEKYGTEIANIWKDFQIEDPYELCFGFLYLLDNGSDLPWLYTPALGVLNLCAIRLPWAFFSNRRDVYSDSVAREEYSEIVPIIVDDAVPSDELPFFSKAKNAYEMEYALQDEQDGNFLPRFNLSQLMFAATGCILPRDFSCDEKMLSFLNRCGVTDSGELSFFSDMISLLNQTRMSSQLVLCRDEDDSFFDDEWDEECDEDWEEEECNVEDVEALFAKIEALQMELKHLKSVSYEAQREAREERNLRERAEKKAELDRQELADLRELVFHQQEDIYTDDTPDVSISFPFQTKKRFVVFGGHDSWAREIKPKLPNVRFVDRNMVPNQDLIRHADMIWIQSNALCHAFFYKIIDEARRYNIPVRYFSFASATKCAEQIVQEELSS